MNKDLLVKISSYISDIDKSDVGQIADSTRVASTSMFNEATGNDGSYVDRIGNAVSGTAEELIRPIASLASLASGNADVVNSFNDLSANTQGYNMVTGQVNSSDIGTFAGGALSFGTGMNAAKGLAGLTKGLVQKSLGKEADNILTAPVKKGTFSSMANESGIAALTSPLYGTQSKINDEGVVEYDNRSIRDPNAALQNVVADALIGAPIDAALHVGQTRLVEGRSNSKVNSAFTGSEFATFSSPDTQKNILLTINKSEIDVLANQKAEGKPSPYSVDEGSGLIIVSDEKFSDIENKTTKNSNNPKDLNNIAVMNENGDILIAAKGVGVLKGVINETGKIILDTKNSHALPEFLKLKSGNKRIIDFGSEGTISQLRSEYEATKKSVESPEEKRAHHEISNVRNAKVEDGQIISDSDIKESTSDGILSTITEATGVSNTSGKRTILGEAIVSGADINTDTLIGHSSKTISSIGKVASVIKKYMPKLNGENTSQQGKIAAIGEKINNAIVSAFSKNDDNFDNFVNSIGLNSVTAREEFVRALHTSTIETIMSLKEKGAEKLEDGSTVYAFDPETVTKNFSKKIAQRAFEIMGYDGKGQKNIDSILKDLSDVVDGIDIKDLIFEKNTIGREANFPKASKVSSDPTNLIENSVMLHRDLSSIVDDINKMSENVSDTIDPKQKLLSTFKSASTRKRDGINIGNRTGRVNGHTGQNNKFFSRFGEATRLSKVVRSFNVDAFNVFKKTFESIKDKKQLSDELNKLSKDSHDFLKVENDDTVQSIIRDIETIQNIIDNGNEFTLDVSIDNNGRPMYDGDSNPHTSKIFRYFQRFSEHKLLDLSNPAHVDILKETTIDALKIDKSTAKLDLSNKNDLKKFMKLVENAKTDSIEKLVFKSQLLSSIKDGKADIVFSFDSTNNNYAIFKAMLGIADSDVRFFSDNETMLSSDGYNKKDTLPSMITGELKRTFGQGLGKAIDDLDRDAGKAIATPFLYMSSPNGVGSEFVKLVLMKVLSYSKKDRLNSLPSFAKNHIVARITALENKINRLTLKEGDFNTIYEAFKKMNLDDELSILDAKTRNDVKSSLDAKVDDMKSFILDNLDDFLFYDAYKSLFETNKFDYKTASHFERIQQEIVKIENSPLQRFMDAVRNEQNGVIDARVLKFMENLESVLTVGKLRFLDAIDNKHEYGFSFKEIKEIVNDIDGDIKNSAFNSSFHESNKYSLNYLIEFLASNGSLEDKKFMDHALVFKKFGKLAIVNPFNGDTMSLNIFRGNQTFISKEGIVVPGLNTGSIMTPVFIQSIEQSIASRSFVKGNGENVFDAIYGGADILEGAKASNNLLATMLRDQNGLGNGYNLLKGILNTMGIDGASLSIKNSLVNENLVGKLLRDLSIKNADGKEGIHTFSDADIKEHTSKISETLDSLLIENNDESIAKRSKEVSSRKSDISEDIVVNNYSSGNLKSTASGPTVDGVNPLRRIVGRVDVSSSKYNLFEELNSAVVDQTKTRFTKLTNAVSGVLERLIKIDFEAGENSFSKSINTIRVSFSHKDFSMKNFRKLVHEIVHTAESGVTTKYGNLEDAIAEVDRIFDSIVVEQSNGEKLDASMLASEKIAGILSELLTNESLRTSSSEFINKLSDNGKIDVKLGNEARSIEYVNKDGTSVYINSVDDFMNVLRANDVSESDLIRIKDIVDASREVMSSYQVLDYMNGLEPAKDANINTVLKRDEDVMFKDKMDKALSWTQNLSRDFTLLELIGADLTKDREAMNKAIGIGEAIKSTINEITQAVQEDIDAKFKGSGTEVEIKKFKNTIGKAVSMGLSMFTEELRGNRSLFEEGKLVQFLKEHLAKELKSLDDQNSLRTLIKKAIEHTIPEKSNLSAKINQEIKAFEDSLDAIAEGRNDAFKGDIDSVVHKLVNRLYNANVVSNKNVSSMKNKLEKIVAAKRILFYAESRGKQNVDDLSGTPAIQDFIKSAIDVNKQDIILSVFDMHNAHRTPYNLFGTNFKTEFSKSSTTLSVVPESRFKEMGINPRSVIGRAFKDGESYVFFSASDSNYIVGKQDSHIKEIEIDRHSYQAGVLKSGEFTVFLNSYQMNTANSSVDVSIDTQITRNAYLSAHEKMMYSVAREQFKILSDNGLIMAAKNIREEIAHGRNMDNWEVLPQDHPLSQMAGGRMYFNKSHLDLLLGTKGYNIRELTKHLGSMNNLTFHSLRTLIDLSKGLKGTILLGRMGGYINNIVGNTFQVMMHAPNPLSIAEDTNWAHKEMKSFRKVLNEYAKAYSSKNEQRMLAAEQAMQSHTLYEAYSNNIFSTIRTSSFALSSYEELSIIGDLNRIDKTGNTGKMLKALFFDPSTKHGNFLGNVFDMTEIIPKLVLWKNLGDMSPSEKAQYIQFAFPTYQNLPFLANAVDQVYPFTKYAMNYPKMMLFTMYKSFHKMALVNAALPMVAMASWGDREDKNYSEYENLLIPTPFGDAAYNVSNALMVNFFNTPYGKLTGQTDLTPFAISVFANMKDVPSFFLPGTLLPHVEEKKIATKAKKEASPSS